MTIENTRAVAPVISILMLAENRQERIALESDAKALNYGQLAESIRKVAAEIQDHGESVNQSRILLLANSSIELVVGLLAIQYSGNAYIPLESKVPFLRISEMITAARPKAILCDAQNVELANEIASKFNIQVFLLEIDKKESGELLICVNEKELIGNKFPSTLTDFGLDHPAVVFFTSGSTGKPKGVELFHLGYWHWFQSIKNILPLKDGDRIGFTTNISFDLSLGEILLGLMSGNTLVICDQEVVRDPVAYLNWLQNKKISIMQSVPSLLKQVVLHNTDNTSLADLKCLMMCGEALEVQLVRDFKQRFPMCKADVINLYGPVETSIQVSYCWADEYINSENINVPIGQPFQSAKLKLARINESDQFEICIAGNHLANGYLDVEKTTRAFVRDETHFGSSEIFYRTGDLGRINIHGDYECLGRIDDQIKIKGYRVELGEIEHVIKNQQDIYDACVVSVKIEGLDTLIAFVISEHKSAITLRRNIAQVLPGYMLPKVIFVDNIPLTINGKRDKVKLCEMLCQI